MVSKERVFKEDSSFGWSLKLMRGGDKVHFEIRGPKGGYIGVLSFNLSTLSEIRKALEEMETEVSSGKP